jgi:hypothetical protein
MNPIGIAPMLQGNRGNGGARLLTSHDSSRLEFGATSYRNCRNDRGRHGDVHSSQGMAISRGEVSTSPRHLLPAFLLLQDGVRRMLTDDAGFVTARWTYRSPWTGRQWPSMELSSGDSSIDGHFKGV